MSPQELNRCVAEATGESVSEIRARGFGLLVLSGVTEDASVSEPIRRSRRRRRRGSDHPNSQRSQE